MNNKEHPNFTTVREDFNIYEIENGQVLRTKQIITDIVVEKREDNKKMADLAMKPVSYVVTNVEIDTSNFELSAPDKVTEKDQIKELGFRPVKEVVNIYETESALLFLTLKVQKVFLTNKKDNTGAPILRYETLTGFNTLAKDTLEEQKPSLEPILTTSQLNIFSERFLCELCKQTNRTERARRSIDVYGALKIGAFDEKVIPRIIDEITQDLTLKNLISYQNNREEVKLTREGLNECKKCY